MHNDWSCSVQAVVGSETPMDWESYQVTEASSDALHEIYDGLSSLPTMTISDMIMPSTRKDIETNEIIYIPERSAQYIFEGKQFAFAAISSVHGDDALVVDGGATLLLLNRLTIVLRSDQRWLLSRQRLDLRQSTLPMSAVRHTSLLIELESFDQLR